MEAVKYMLVQRTKTGGKKWYGVAGTNEGRCLAGASDVFIEAGYPNQWHHPEFRVVWGDVEQQKNYGGRLPIYKTL